MQEQFTKYEIARIIGARALQIAMDAPLLVKIPDAKLKEMNYDALQIAEFELNSSVLPITVQRPTPRRKKDKIAAVKEDHVSDEDLIAKEKEVEQEIVEGAEELGFVNAGEEEVGEIETPSEEQ
jgi:DNA-directed RNA polymerase subunit K